MSSSTSATLSSKPTASSSTNKEQKDSKKKDDDDEEEEEDVEQLQYKVCVLGDGAVGKTSICKRFIDDHFDKYYKQTVGVDFFLRQVVLPGDVHVSLQLWDIGGQSIGSKMIGKYIYGSQAVLIAYDVTNFQSFQDVDDWLRVVKQTFDKEPLPYIAIVGNKADVVHLRTVKEEKHNQYANENSLHRYLMSAKTGEGVNMAFTRVAADLAGIALTKPEMDASAKVVKAEVINHPQHDSSTPQLQLTEKKSRCSIM
eukprot:TRINITY_DN1552_c0_g1_i1.p1 TRINITY_DN1552_c0_g1~~TRINITY_DN1552_c0_g1_i1.p1  ORF type:complete len:255 (-),score=56.45 TRINITY_DN1552_c0_g1_i1:110-874(-)